MKVASLYLRGFMYPDIAVLIAAFNADLTIEAAIESVLSSPRRCRIFVVDDGSRTPVGTILTRYGDQISISRLDKNIGPAAARNVALRKIIDKGFKYVAIMDADDMSYPGRLSLQADFLDTHTDVGAVGAWTRLFDEQTGQTVRINKRATSPADVRNLMFFNIGLSHASAMMRVDALKAVGLYSNKYPAAEDYELLRRIGERFLLANVPEVLLHYRISSGGQSLRRRKQQLYDRLRVQLKYFKFFEWRAWVGALKTLFLFLIPVGVVGWMRSFSLRN